MKDVVERVAPRRRRRAAECERASLVEPQPSRSSSSSLSLIFAPGRGTGRVQAQDAHDLHCIAHGARPHPAEPLRGPRVSRERVPARVVSCEGARVAVRADAAEAGRCTTRLRRRLCDGCATVQRSSCWEFSCVRTDHARLKPHRLAPKKLRGGPETQASIPDRPKFSLPVRPSRRRHHRPLLQPRALRPRCASGADTLRHSPTRQRSR